MPDDDLEFGPAYVEDVDLGDGLRVRLRLIGPQDKQRLQDGLGKLSEQSQYLRFFSVKPRLTDAELAYLTELDGWSHFAVGAARVEDDDSTGEGVGVARFIRLPEDERIAEPAVAVIDAVQGRGVGGLLMNRLTKAARERGVQAFRSEFLATNAGARELFRSMSDVVGFSVDGSVAVAEFPLDRQLPLISPREDEPPRDAMDVLFRLVATQVLEVRRRFATLFQPDEILATLRKFADDLGIGGGD